MDLPTLLVRETVQNSWDAGQRTQIRPITFRIDGWTMDGQSLDVLRSLVFADGTVPGLPALSSVLDQPQVPVVVISDRGTSGLGGATRADILTAEPSDFADFVRNVGQPPDKERSGGTYGYGKAVLFLASRASTIVAYTRCTTEGHSESRLIGIGLGEPYAVPLEGVDRLYTGRHWWGIRDSEAGIEPVTGERADEIAEMIGMPGFETDQHGTSIMIVGADFGELDLASAVTEMSEALVWHCWPQMISVSGQQAGITFTVSFEGEVVPLPDPSVHPDLRGFTQAYRAALGEEVDGVLTSRVEAIVSRSPKQELGTLSIVQFLRDQRLPDSVRGRPFSGPPHHVALMRGPRLVVTYLPGPETPVPGVAWAGAFVAEDAIDRAFAAAEPPSHDDWTPHILPRSHEKTYVNVALRNIREAARLFTHPEPPASSDASVTPLAGIATALGGLLAGDSGPGTRVLPSPAALQGSGNGDGQAGSGSGGPYSSGGGNTGSAVNGGMTRRRRRIARVEVLADRLVMEGDSPAIELSFRLTPADGAVQTRVRAVAGVAVNDGSSLEREQPVGAERPHILRWQVGDRTIPSAELVIDGVDVIEGRVLVAIPPDTTVAVSIMTDTPADSERTG